MGITIASTLGHEPAPPWPILHLGRRRNALLTRVIPSVGTVGPHDKADVGGPPHKLEQPTMGRCHVSCLPESFCPTRLDAVWEYRRDAHTYAHGRRRARGSGSAAHTFLSNQEQVSIQSISFDLPRSAKPRRAVRDDLLPITLTQLVNPAKKSMVPEWGLS